MENLDNLVCQTCGNVGLADGSDGYFYCIRCGSQAEDFVDTGVADEDFVGKGGDTGGAIYLTSHRRQRAQAVKAEPISQLDSFYDSQTQLFKTLGLDDETPQRQGNLQESPIKVEEDLGYGSQLGVAGSSVPEDFGGSSGVRVPPSYEDYYNEIRIRYVMGLQMMIEFQCEALVKEFKVNPLICGLVGPIWLRFVSWTGVFVDDWADQVIFDSEKKLDEEPEDSRPKPRAKCNAEPHNKYNERAVMIWYRSLRKTIPLSCTLAVSLLACHVAREAVLPTDIMKWTLEGRLPYLTAFLEIETRMGKPSNACPISSMTMFKPSNAVPLQKLEALAASIAQSIGLDLPPVNFYAMAYGYLQKLSLPVEKILPHACRIYEWSMPPDLWLSTSTLRLPTRICVMSILIVSMRILYNLNGFGEWEKSLSHDDGASVKSPSGSGEKENDGMDTNFPSYDDGGHCDEVPLQPQKPEWDAARLLHHLYETCNEIAEKYEYSKDLSTYLKQCTDCFFAGLKPSFENHEEEYMMELLMNFYEKIKDSKPAEQVEQYDNSSNRKRPERKECFSQLSPDDDDDGDAYCVPSDVLESMDTDNSPDSEEESESCVSEEESVDNEDIRKLKLDMEENKFCYIPPRMNVKRLDYLHYVRKVDEGAYTYVAHADYYILLRACAKAAQVDIRIMHIGVLSLERRLAWLEKRTDKCLHVKPPRISCQFCTANVAPENVSVDEPGLSNLSI
ncbi:TATA box-binding protein-associated factor RNA polymerase I subunit B [Senna tora]|uniref:TATA box-binding protein-associated factor RNA polymerase I subunit B n=1 Tax=Senna tora TaxID=362788 RepID=A0A834TT84_9FABA|nr:TATA box-binding protein-associated factor RNA polymerase I subunit B [Senna tora]